jgi:hypothetical protein
MSARELDDKFDRLAGSVGSPARVCALRAAIDALPTAGNLAAYAEVLGAPVEVRQ